MSTVSLAVPRDSANKNIVQGVVLATFLTGLSYGVGISLDWVSKLNWLEVFAVFTSYLCTYLCVVERRINYPIGAISTAAYCVLFWQYGLVASAVLNAYLTPSLLYGWIRWRTDTNTRPVAHVSVKFVPVYLAVSGLAYLGALWLVGVLGGTLALTDSVILVGSILAQFLLDNKKLENWLVWLVVNGFAIYTYAHAGLALAAFQYVFFALNSFYGFYMWYRSMNENQVLFTKDGKIGRVDSRTRPLQSPASL